MKALLSERRLATVLGTSKATIVVARRRLGIEPDFIIHGTFGCPDEKLFLPENVRRIHAAVFEMQVDRISQLIKL